MVEVDHHSQHTPGAIPLAMKAGRDDSKGTSGSTLRKVQAVRPRVEKLGYAFDGIEKTLEYAKKTGATGRIRKKDVQGLTHTFIRRADGTMYILLSKQNIPKGNRRFGCMKELYHCIRVKDGKAVMKAAMVCRPEVERLKHDPKVGKLVWKEVEARPNDRITIQELMANPKIAARVEELSDQGVFDQEIQALVAEDATAKTAGYTSKHIAQPSEMVIRYTSTKRNREQEVSVPRVILIQDLADSDGIHFARQENTTPEEVKEVIQQTAGALSEVHSKGNAHCDVKPANLLIRRTKSGVHVTLGDLGLHTSAMTLQTEFTTNQSPRGDPRYAPKEVHPQDHSKPKRARVPQDDILSLGKALWEMHRAAKETDSKMTKVDLEVYDLVIAMLHPNPAKRPTPNQVAKGTIHV